jgi:predicted DCC family thiol-disulfide oxidoreductase YuxK
MRLSVGTAGYGASVAGLTVLYDEGCGFCTRLADWLGRSDGIEVAAIGSETGAVLLRDLSPDERYTELHVVDPLGRRRSGGAALPVLARRLRGGRAASHLFETFPRVTARGYGLVARHRALVSRLTRIRC